MIEALILLLVILNISFTYWSFLMAQQIIEALATQTAAIEALKGRLAGQSGITQAEAQQILDTTNANTASVNAILA